MNNQMYLVVWTTTFCVAALSSPLSRIIAKRKDNAALRHAATWCPHLFAYWRYKQA